MTVSYAVEVGLGHLRAGNRLLAKAKLRVATGGDNAEAPAREGLRSYRSAMNWLEDTGDFEAAHWKLDEAGHWVRMAFGGTLRYDRDGGYSQACPVALAHFRVGISMEARDTTALCSVCGADPRTCRHVTFRTYRASQMRVAGVCNVCKSEHCRQGHADGRLHDLECFHVVTSLAKVDALALVSRPAIPDARIESESVPITRLKEELGPRWVPGMPVSCDRCLGRCRGVREMPSRESGSV